MRSYKEPKEHSVDIRKGTSLLVDMFRPISSVGLDAPDHAVMRSAVPNRKLERDFWCMLSNPSSGVS